MSESAYAHTYRHTYIHTYIHTYRYTYIHTHTYAHVCVYIYIYTHARSVRLTLQILLTVRLFCLMSAGGWNELPPHTHTINTSQTHTHTGTHAHTHTHHEHTHTHLFFLQGGGRIAPCFTNDPLLRCSAIRRPAFLTCPAFPETAVGSHHILTSRNVERSDRCFLGKVAVGSRQFLVTTAQIPLL